MPRLLKLALFTLLTVGLTTWIGASIARIASGPTIALHAEFGDVTGLVAGDAVRVAGVPVGQVTGVAIQDNGRARVDMVVDPEVVVPSDSTAAISWVNLIGQRQVDILPGEATTALADGDAFADTTDVVDLATIADSLAPFARTLDPEGLNELFATILLALDGQEDDVARLLDNLDGLLVTLVDRRDTVDGLIVDADQLTATLASREDQIEAMIDNLVAVTETFAGSTDLLVTALEDGTTIATDLQRFLTTNEATLAEFLDAVEVVAAYAADRTDVLETVAVEMALTLPEFFDVVAYGDAVNARFTCVTVTDPPCQFPDGQLTPVLGDLLEPVTSLLPDLDDLTPDF